MPDPTPPTAEERAALAVVAWQSKHGNAHSVHPSIMLFIAAALREHARAMRERCAAWCLDAARDNRERARQAKDNDDEAVLDAAALAFEGAAAALRALEVP